jgi:WD40 repeat protein
MCLSFKADGKRLLSYSSDEKIRIFDLTYNCLLPYGKTLKSIRDGFKYYNVSREPIKITKLHDIVVFYGNTSFIAKAEILNSKIFIDIMDAYSAARREPYIIELDTSHDEPDSKLRTPITALITCKSNNKIACGSRNGWIAVVNTYYGNTVKLRHSVSRFNATITSLSFNPDESLLISGGF